MACASLFSSPASRLAKLGASYWYFRMTFVVNLNRKFNPLLTTCIVKMGQSRTNTDKNTCFYEFKEFREIEKALDIQGLFIFEIR